MESKQKKDSKETSIRDEKLNSYIESQKLRAKAIEWWNNLPVWGNPSKEYYIGLYYSDDTVTPEQIEQIWLKETQEQQYSIYNSTMKNTEDCGKITVKESKPNQKQFKTFNSELARAYLNKFDDNAKKHFCLEAFNMLSKSDLHYLKACLTEIISEK